MTRSRSPTRSRSSCPTLEGSSKPVASLDSSIRSAARATSSAYRRLPIRWRLAGGSALLTLVILCGFAAIVGVLTTGRIRDGFNREVVTSADTLEQKVRLRPYFDENDRMHLRREKGSPQLDDYAAAQNAAIRIITQGGFPIFATAKAPSFGPYIAQSIEVDGWRVETRPT